MMKLVFLLAILGAAQLIGCAAARGTILAAAPAVASEAAVSPPEPNNDTKVVDVHSEPQKDTTIVEVPPKQESLTQEDHGGVEHENSTREDEASGEVGVPQEQENSTQEDQASEELEVPLEQETSTQEDQASGEVEVSLKQENSPPQVEVPTQEDQASGEVEVSLKQENSPPQVEVPQSSTQEDQASGEVKQEKSTQEDHAGGEVEVPEKQENSTQEDGASGEVEVPQKQENSTQGSSGVEVPLKQENSTQEDDAGGRVEEKDFHCCGSRLRSCLSFSGDGSHGELSLHVHSHGDFNVKITPPSFLRVDPSEFKAEKDTKTTVNIEMLDSESAKLQALARITIDSEDGLCQIELPSSRSSLVRRFNYPTVRTEVVVFGMLAFALASYALAVCCSHRRKQEDVRYQEVEMADREESAAEVSIPVQGWEWDDDWEATEARKSLSSRASGSMSPESLASRKATKEGWED